MTCTVRRDREVVEPAMADGSIQGLAQGHDLLMHGVISWRLAAFRDCLFVAVDAVFLNFAGSDIRKARRTEERHQMHARPVVLAFDVDFTALLLRDDVVFTQVQV